MEQNGWRGDMDELYAQHLDEICSKIRENMVALRGHLDHTEFMTTMQTITKEVITHGQQNPDN
jgi:hypothetical protein